MADSIEHYRGYDLAFYWSGRDKVRVQIRESSGLAPIHIMPLERSLDEARQAAKKAVDEKLSPPPSD